MKAYPVGKLQFITIRTEAKVRSLAFTEIVAKRFHGQIEHDLFLYDVKKIKLIICIKTHVKFLNLEFMFFFLFELRDGMKDGLKGKRERSLKIFQTPAAL